MTHWWLCIVKLYFCLCIRIELRIDAENTAEYILPGPTHFTVVIFDGRQPFKGRGQILLDTTLPLIHNEYNKYSQDWDTFLQPSV